MNYISFYFYLVFDLVGVSFDFRKNETEHDYNINNNIYYNAFVVYQNDRGKKTKKSNNLKGIVFPVIFRSTMDFIYVFEVERRNQTFRMEDK